MSEAREYLIKKGSYFYRPDCAGYTSFKFDAGRYTKERAEQEASVEPWHMEAIHQDDVADSSDPDKFIAALTQERDRLREALEFYANPEIYKPHPHGPAFDRRDLSFHARSALNPVGAS
ncbi:hypothetical protein ELG76_04000 [Rhizobium leguminosarum]|uniref:hypothetical protein n=1 Tax=Rhizobium leguminosarum TaxID=384 RepID=UPI00103265E9|nr:hypothetical protein [Rhizobium leguminosarum]TBG78584.1 hypothetical protein ELG76_04000 [Rhizobium leguminosarum]